MGPVLERNRERAERVLDREYSQLRSRTLNALRSKLALRYASGVHFADTDLEAFYNQAWHGLYLRLAQGEEIDNHAGFLVHASYCRAIEEMRRMHPDRTADAAEIEEVGVEPDFDALLDDHVQLTHFMEGMRDQLTGRERQAATLCYIHGCTRPQASEALGVSPKRMEKLMDSVSLKIGALISDIREGTWCERRTSLMKAYAFGVLDPDGERWQLAAEHLDECPGCRRYVRGLRGIAAVSPPVGLPLAALAAVGFGGAAGASAGAGAGGGAAGSAGAGSAGAGSAGAGAGAGSSAAAGSTAAAGAGAGGIGATAVAATAAAIVAVSGVGAFAMTRDGAEERAATTASPPARVAAPTSGVRRVPAVATVKPKPKPKAKATKRRAAKKRKATPKPAAVTPAATTVVTTPAQTTPAPVVQASPAPARPRPAPRPTGDAGQEFGFEK